MEEEKNSLAYDMLKALKAVIIFLSIIIVVELIVIGVLGCLLYDSQFDYSTTETQDVSNTDVNNSSIVQY